MEFKKISLDMIDVHNLKYNKFILYIKYFILYTNIIDNSTKIIKYL